MWDRFLDKREREREIQTERDTERKKERVREREKICNRPKVNRKRKKVSQKLRNWIASVTIRKCKSMCNLFMCHLVSIKWLDHISKSTSCSKELNVYLRTILLRRHMGNGHIYMYLIKEEYMTKITLQLF